jgi:hypothetical protein
MGNLDADNIKMGFTEADCKVVNQDLIDSGQNPRPLIAQSV